VSFHTLPPAPARALKDISSSGLGTAQAWEHLRRDVLPTALPSDHPGYLAFIPGAPSVAAILADMAISASGVYAGSALEGVRSWMQNGPHCAGWHHSSAFLRTRAVHSSVADPSPT